MGGAARLCLGSVLPSLPCDPGARLGLLRRQQVGGGTGPREVGPSRAGPGWVRASVWAISLSAGAARHHWCTQLRGQALLEVKWGPRGAQGSVRG